MSIGPHVDPEDLGQIDSLPESHEARRHVNECPRCRAALEAYRAFVEVPAGIPEADLAAARAGLEAARAGRSRSAGARAATSSDRRAWAWAGWRPVLALSVAAAVAIAIYATNADRFRGERSLLLRGDSIERGPVGRAETRLELLEIVRDRNGVRLRWRAVPGADGYSVIVFGARLEEVTRHEAGADTSLSVETSAGNGESGGLYWQVVALREGEEVAASEMIPMNRR